MIDTRTLAVLLACIGTNIAVHADERWGQIVDFNREIRPILADTCFQCHGPDQEQRQAELRLDTKNGMLGERNGEFLIVPGDSANSELYRRIVSRDDDYRMPPVNSDRQLSDQQIRHIKRWIVQGATWQEHWSFVPPIRHPIPRVENVSWVRNPVDHFILARLEREGLSPAFAASKATLLRRVSFDLTGLPPDDADVTQFLEDRSAAAYERAVDRLLASPRFGERMASRWLDAARYADTSGYQNDGPRSMWRWRDWVIDAYNQGMPFDQFTVEQLAGDLLPQATLQQRIATGFNRNHRGNAEGGIIPEEYAVEYVVDRVDTTATTWLGLTLGCARCHDHKYDPITQREFYQFFAYFNNVPEFGRAIKEGNSPPWIQAPTWFQRQALRKIDTELDAARERVESLASELDEEQRRWESGFRDSPSDDWSPTQDQVAHFRLNGNTREVSTDLATNAAQGVSQTFSEGVFDKAVELTGDQFIDAGDIGRFGYFDKFSLSAWIYPIQSADNSSIHGGTIVSRMIDQPRETGYALTLEGGRVHVHLVKRWLDDAIRVRTANPLRPHRWHHVMATYDGTRVAKGICIYVNGKQERLHVDLDLINQSFVVDEPFRIGGGNGPGGRFHGRIDDVRVYGGCLSADEVGVVATAESIRAILDTPRRQRSPAQIRKLRLYFLSHAAPAAIVRAHDELERLREKRHAFLESIPTVMVMQEMATPRETYVLERGQYDLPGERVDAGVPACLPRHSRGAIHDRLGLARWIVHPRNPLTSRVAVNRYWEMFFGTGLVTTLEDFGVQGERPSHPQLLDWLATEFVRTGWSVKAMVRLIVTSATYRQSASASPELLARDPGNRLLARGRRFRLAAEMIRDQALATSGLLVERVGGPSVRPYQVEGLWEEIASDTNYEQSKGVGLYRRSIYTYWKRTVSHPTMMTFDASPRETCVVRKTRTNTPLQALALMNDVTFVESARVLAQQVLADPTQTLEERVRTIFQRVLCRPPTNGELDILLEGVRANLDSYRGDNDAARQLVQTGEYPMASTLDASELAAYTVLASLVLNLDETVTRE